jgi:hypothetical protein
MRIRNVIGILALSRYERIPRSAGFKINLVPSIGRAPIKFVIEGKSDEGKQRADFSSRELLVLRHHQRPVLSSVAY